MNRKQTISSPASFCELSLTAEKKLRQFESEWARGKSPQIESFIDDGDPALLEELIRVDMELRTERGLPFSVPKYLERFPMLTGSTGALGRIESEANRLKVYPGSNKTAPKASFPEVASNFLGFELIGVLGEGAFGRVYLARQGDLARRLVVLKITTTRNSEADRLAQLQHTNIVPIYSQHEQNGLHAICMPFLGIATLADLIPASSGISLEAGVSPREYVSTVARRKSDTIPILAKSNCVFPESGNLSSTDAGDSPPSLSGREAPITASTASASGGSYEALGDRSREETFAWLCQQIATGMAFAHSQGIIHGDIKPANILISDRGYPMLLDFNLAIHRKDHAPELVGGTLPYLSPEQIQAISSGKSIDERNDLYSLGVVFYQLLAGQLPFPDRGSSFESASKLMLEDRLRGAPPLTQVVPGLNKNLAAIIDKSLDPKIEHRYQSAPELLEDLQRFQSYQPLRHAANRSFTLRVKNWTRRHPRLMSASSVGLIAAILLAGVGSVTLASWQRNFRLQAAESTRHWLADMKSLRCHLTSVDPPQTTLATRVVELERLIQQAPEGMTVDAIADDRVSLLSNEQAGEAKQEIVASHLGLAGALLRRCAIALEKDRQSLAEQIRRHHQWVLQHFPQQAQSAGFMLQQSRLASVLGEAEQASRLREQASKLPADDSFDRNLLAYELLTLGEFEKAAELLEQAVNSDGLDMEAWLLLGNARAQQKRLAEAEACFSLCLSLDPQSETAVFNRARVRFDLGNFEGALADYGRAITLNPNEPAYFANRGLISMARQDWAKAQQDFSAALERSNVEPRILYLRHQVNTALGRHQSAAEDLDTFLKSKPSDETGWVLRGVANLQQGNRQQALLDFDEALKVNPNSSMAWQNKATILAGEAENSDKAIAAMFKVVDINPRDATQIATRGVLLARAGKRAEALRDAERALELDRSADTRYRVAGIYALTSRQEPADKRRAISLIAMATMEQPQLVLGYLEHDPDIENLKTDPQWLELTKALEKIREQADDKR